jgi:hypothetical protein
MPEASDASGRTPFSLAGSLIFPDRCPHEPNLWKAKTGDPNFRTADKTFFAHSAGVFTQARDWFGISELAEVAADLEIHVVRLSVI